MRHLLIAAALTASTLFGPSAASAASSAPQSTAVTASPKQCEAATLWLCLYSYLHELGVQSSSAATTDGGPRWCEAETFYGCVVAPVLRALGA